MEVVTKLDQKKTISAANILMNNNNTIIEVITKLDQKKTISVTKILMNNNNTIIEVITELDQKKTVSATKILMRYMYGKRIKGSTKTKTGKQSNKSGTVNVVQLTQRNKFSIDGP